MNDPIGVVGIGGSAGAIEAFRGILTTLPADTGLAFVFILHMSPHTESGLVDVLSRWTRMPVTWALDRMPLRPNCIFVIQPNTDLAIDGNELRTRMPRTFTKRHHQVNQFFISLAAARKSQAIAVVLSGGDGDGAEGCQHMKAIGGVVIAQDDSARVGGMPRSAEFAGHADFVLPPAKIAEKLVELAAGSASHRPS